MATIYVARSRSLEAWALEVGLTRHVYSVGLCEDDAASAIADMNAGRYAGRNDWTLVRSQPAPADITEEEIRARLARKETPLDPKYYPQIRGAGRLVKVKGANAENWLLVQRALAGEVTKLSRISVGDIAAYLLRVASD